VPYASSDKGHDVESVTGMLPGKFSQDAAVCELLRSRAQAASAWHGGEVAVGDPMMTRRLSVRPEAYNI
jgi:hypothetical protein